MTTKTIVPTLLADQNTAKPLTPGQLIWRRFRKHRMALAGAIGIMLLLGFIIGGSFVIPEKGANQGNL